MSYLARDRTLPHRYSDRLLGYTIYDQIFAVYRERPDKPNSIPNPDEDCSGLSEEMLKFLRFLLVTVSGGEEFPEPFCFGLDT